MSFDIRNPRQPLVSTSTIRVINNLPHHHLIASIKSRLPCIANLLARARGMIPQHRIIRNKRISSTIILMIIIRNIACIQVPFHLLLLLRHRFYNQDKHYQPLDPVIPLPNSCTMVVDYSSPRLRTLDHLVFNTGRPDFRHYPTTPNLRRANIPRTGD